MEPNKNKSALGGGYFIPTDDWIAMALVLDQIAMHHLKDAPAGCAAYGLAMRLRAVADYARDPYNEAKIK
jgi:hypothetical protein